MVQPNLIHPVPVEIQQIDLGGTFMDPDAREPVQHATRATTVTVPGQPRWNSQLTKGHERGGRTESAIGYVVFRTLDLNANSVVLQVNDRFKKIGTVDTDVFIERLEHTGHYPDQGGPTLVKAHFTDRQPSKQRRAS
ncbi:hypothetical protein LCGC14_0835790 [marine sediment metagenome]|uniref:Uncharacterized protein n=1 Tax=marine sediment metagenome TaxID=412755 RepID=A0A0F9PJC0_9ZZZZ